MSENWDKYKPQEENYKQKDFYASVSKKQHESINGYPKPYQKSKAKERLKFDDVLDSPKEKSYSLRYKEHMQKNRAWNQAATAFTDEEVEKIYWEQLAELGWKRFNKRGFVMACPMCDVILIQAEQLTKDALGYMTNESHIKKLTTSHKCETEA